MRACPFCGSTAAGPAYPYETHWDGQHYRYLRCSSCRTTYVDPAPSAAALERFYDQAAYHSEHYDVQHENSQQTTLPQVRHLLKADGDLLDFGCGNGFFLKAAAAVGFRPEGVELDEKTREWATANSGCDVNSLEAVEASGRRYDVIHLGDVLEHLPDPKALMLRLEALLKPDGRFFIEGPLEENPSPVRRAVGIYDWLKGLLGKRRRGTFVPTHLLRTDARSQRRFFETALGYRVHAFRISEDGWPYWSRTDSLLRPRSAGHAVRMAIGAAAVAASRVAVPFGLNLGNRFSAVLSPQGQVKSSV